MIGSWTDWELSARGRQQAHNIAFNLKEEMDVKDFCIYASPLTRTRQTAEIIASSLDIPLVRYSDALKERSLGRAIGRSVQWLKQNIESEERTVYDRCFSDAESRADVWERLSPFYEEILKIDNEKILLVSHGDTLSIWNVMWLRLPLQSLNNMDIYGVTGGVTFMYQTEQGKRIIRRMSDTSFMQKWR